MNKKALKAKYDDDMDNVICLIHDIVWPVKDGPDTTHVELSEDMDYPKTITVAMRKFELLKKIALQLGFDPVVLQAIMDDV